MVQSIGPTEAQALIARGEIDIVDVREPNEWSTGHLPGARHVPLAQLRRSPKVALARDGVMFVCAAGVRSESAAKVALQHGYANVYSLVGGTRGWVAAGFQLVREP